MVDDNEDLTPAEDRGEAFKDMVVRASEMGVHYGLFNAVMEQYPEHVQEGFLSHMRDTTDWLDARIEEVQSFGESFDPDGE